MDTTAVEELAKMLYICRCGLHYPHSFPGSTTVHGVSPKKRL